MKSLIIIALFSSLTFFTTFSTAQESCDRHGCWKLIQEEDLEICEDGRHLPRTVCEAGVTRQNNGSFYCLEDMSEETAGNIGNIVLFMYLQLFGEPEIKSDQEILHQTGIDDPIYLEMAYQYLRSTWYCK